MSDISLAVTGTFTKRSLYFNIIKVYIFEVGKIERHGVPQYVQIEPGVLFVIHPIESNQSISASVTSNSISILSLVQFTVI